jgi:sarcosine oxidase
MFRHDAIVLGLGAMGSAAAYQLAKRGERVLGFDRYAPPHSLGSSHGDTRITRLAIGEGDHLVPLVMRAHEIWREVERETGENLLMANGGLILSSDQPTSFTHVEGFFQNTVAAAQKFGIAHERLDASAIRRRFPAFKVRDNEIGYYERDAGFLRPEACVDAQLRLAKRNGAELRTNETVLRFEESSSGVQVETDRGIYQADRLIVTAGAWLPRLLGGDCAKLFRIYRQVLHWFAVEGDIARYVPERFPVFIWELQGETQGIYGFPAIDGAGGGFKIATESYASTTTADGADRDVAPEEVARMFSRFVSPRFEGVGARCIRSKVCLYTATPDFGFIVDWLPGSERILIGSACSGHGFKHSATVGEILAELAYDGRTRFDIRPLQFARFAA